MAANHNIILTPTNVRARAAGSVQADRVDYKKDILIQFDNYFDMMESKSKKDVRICGLLINTMRPDGKGNETTINKK